MALYVFTFPLQKIKWVQNASNLSFPPITVADKPGLRLLTKDTDDFMIKLNLVSIQRHFECNICKRFIQDVTVAFECLIHKCKYNIYSLKTQFVQ